MKKLISMMLMLCAIVTFSACSSDDDGPTNPVTNPVVPTSAKIGAEVTVQGSGFATGQTLLLQPAEGEAVNVNARMSTNGATFTVPYTMTVGKVSVVLKNGNDIWTLGSINLLAADNPISAMVLPEEMAIGKEATIAGLGFADGDKIVLGDAADKAIAGTATADGLKFTVPADQAEGEYTVSLVRGASSWQLAQTYVYQPRQIESITISEHPMLGAYASMLGLEGSVLTLNLAYNNDGSLSGVTSNSNLNWEVAYEGKTVTVTGSMSAPLVYTLDDQNRVVACTAQGVEYVWSYDANGYLVSVKPEGAADDSELAFGFTYTEGNMSAYNMGEFTNSFSTDKAVRVCPNTVEPIILHNCFGYLFGRDDLFFGALLSRNVKISAYVPSQFGAADMDMDGSLVTNPFAIEKSFADNALTIKTSGAMLSGAQGLAANTVVVKYKNK
ncbi:hypothetical protein [uncultured Prevotella sp.]|uniref:hypothetical protein n=1 Tax=uncultured Prevotella sp. TaxID=159272 RepID=UPI00262AEBEE|nr:hypothetical protein [uncultured Prevotella sp.]